MAGWATPSPRSRLGHHLRAIEYPDPYTPVGVQVQLVPGPEGTMLGGARWTAT